ncbi:MAG: bacillithiol biosynthesis cysteine-adding enzyme BshC [Gemmatimonadaceae bacterium]
MEEPRVVTEPLGGSPLAQLAVEERAPAEWYARRPRNPNEWREQALRVRSEVDGGWSQRLAPAFVQREASAQRLARVVAQQGIVVTTGQQPGLFGGPIYTTSKALSALALADAIEAATGVPAAPVFWAATDDADFIEAASTAVIIDGAAQELRIPRDPRSDGNPLFAVPLPPVDALIGRLEEASGSSSDARPISLVRRSYRAGSTIGSAFVELLAELLGPLGITILDAGHESVRAAGHEVMRKALTSAQGVEREVAKRDEELRRAGYTPQVESLAGRSLVFELRGSKTRVPVERAAAVARAARPGELAPNVLLRPVVERAILPTVAYLAGPGELAYFAQTSAVADALDMARPLAVPRWSVTIVEPHVQRIVSEFGLSVNDLAALHNVEARLAREIVPNGVSAELQALRGAIDQRMADLRGEVETAPNVPLRSDAIEGARRALHFRVDRLERRVLAAAKHTDSERRRRIASAAASLYPLNKRQERAANLIPFLARYGSRLLDTMRREAANYAQRLVTGLPTS